MAIEVRTIDLTLVSATELKKVKKFKQQKCYVVAYIYPAQRQATLADNFGGVNPTWNAAMTLTCYESDLYPDVGRSSSRSVSGPSSSNSYRVITIDIYSHSTGIFSSGDKLVGTVVVPLQHIASVVQLEGLTNVAFDVRRPSGKVQGKLNLNVKLGAKHVITGVQQQAPSYAYHNQKIQASSVMPPVTVGYNTASGAQSTHGVFNPNSNTYDKQEVVTGYPYGFAPLGPLPAAGNPQSGHGSYPNYSPKMTRRQRREARRAAKHAELAQMDPSARRARKRAVWSRHLTALLIGGVIVGLILL